MADRKLRPASSSRQIRTPALDAWRRELAQGRRTPTTFDPLWRAACAEMNALGSGAPEAQASYIEEARRIIQAARKLRAA